MNVKDTNYFCIQAWMVTKLGLRGAERDVYAIIYGYSQDEDSDFHGSLAYLSQMTGYSRNAICTALKNLTDAGLLLKQEKVINNVKFCKYRTSGLYGCQTGCTDMHENHSETVQVALTNNKENNLGKNNKKDNKEDICRKPGNLLGLSSVKHDITVTDSEIETFKNLYHEICTNMPKIKVITDKRKSAIKKLIRKYSLEDIKTVFTKANESDFLLGRTGGTWKADIDFILRDDKFINILEGKYDGKQRSNVSSEEPLIEDRRANKKKFWEDVKNGKAEKF